MTGEQKPLSEVRKAVERLTFRLIVAMAATILVVTCAGFVWDKMSPFILCVPIAAALQPVVNFLVKKCRLKRSPATASLVVLILLIMIAGIYWLAAVGISRLNMFVSGVPALIAGASVGIRKGFEELLVHVESISPEVVTTLRSLMNDGIKWLTTQGTALSARLVGLVGRVAAGLPDAFIYLNFLMVAMFFITRDYPRIRAKLPGGKAYDPNSNASKLTKAGILGAMAYLRMQTIYGVISLVVGWIYLSVFNVPYSWLIALLAGFLEFLPLFGNGTLYIPWSIIAYILGMPRIGTIVMVLYLLLITFRRCTEPKIMSDSIGVSPLSSLVGMFIGLRMGGLLGLVGGPIVMTILGAVVHGTYLNGIRRDVRTLVSWAWRRWDWAAPSTYKPAEEQEPAEAAPAPKPADRKRRLSRRAGKK